MHKLKYILHVIAAVLARGWRVIDANLVAAVGVAAVGVAGILGHPVGWETVVVAVCAMAAHEWRRRGTQQLPERQLEEMRSRINAITARMGLKGGIG